jgi:hypothetical protein
MRARFGSAILLLSFALAGAVVSGCSSQQGQNVTPTKTPRPTFTPTPVATPTPVFTPTETPVPPTATPTPNPNLNPLTGLVVSDTTVLKRRPLEVAINNMPVARPQYGLAQADVVFEYVMEGWSVTRFTAVYLGQEAERIGPVRSARLINLHLAPMFDAALVASGASVEVRWLLRNKAKFPYLDIDLDDSANTDYSTSIGTYWETRLQTSTAALRRWLQSTGQEKVISIKPLLFASTPLTGSVAAAGLHVPYPQNSIVDWTFDTASGRYLRSVAGERHLDGATGNQLGATNVVVLFAAHDTTSVAEDTLGNTAIQIGLAGEGRCIVLRDGLAWNGRWRWDVPLDAATLATGDTIVVPQGTGVPLQLLMADGQPIPLRPGTTWFEVVPSDATVDIK